MSWKIEKSGDAWNVIEEAGGENPGKVFGIFDSELKAKKQLAALEESKVQGSSAVATQIPGELPAGDSQLTSRGFQMADKLYRCVRAEGTDDLTKTIQVAFSSEYPVKRIAGKMEEKLGAAKRGEEYLEILSHETGDADFSTLNRTAPVLDEHEDAVQIGNVKLARISKDKKGRAVLEFDGLTDLSNLRYEQLKRKKRSISVGYDHKKYLGDVKLADGKVGKRFAWAPDEVSTVARPADLTAGAKRSADEDSACIGCGEMFSADDLDENFMCEECRGDQVRAKPVGDKPAAAAAAAAEIVAKAGRSVDFAQVLSDGNNLTKKTMKIKIGNEELEIADQTQLEAAVKRTHSAARAEVMQRRKSIRDLSDQYIKELPSKRSEIIALADAADADENLTPEQFSRNMLFTEMPKLRAANPKVVDEDELHEDINEYSIARAVRSAVQQNKQGAIPTGLEGEVHAEMCKRSIGCAPQGFWVPFNRKIKTTERMTRARMVRAPGDMQIGVFGQGGALVPTELQLPVIEILRNKMVTERLGVRTISGLEGFVAWPRAIGTSAPYFVPETFMLSVTNPQLDQLMGVPHRVGVTGAYSKQLVLQSAIDIENFMRDDQLKALAVKMDYETLLGSGANDEPTGIFNTIGIGSVNFGGPVTYQKVVNFKTQLALANAAVSDMAYVTTPLVEEKWRTTPKVGTTFPIFIWEDGSWGDDTADGRVIGLRATATNQIVNDRVGFGNFADANRLLWGGLDIVVNPFTRSKEAVVEITTNAWMDVMVRHQGSFAFSADAGDQ
jgi:HK97 family phage major capsid protein